MEGRVIYQNIFYDRNSYMIYVWDDKKSMRAFPYERYAYIKDSGGTYTSLYGDRVKKIHKWVSDSTGLFESDVNPVTRTLVDMYTDSDIPSTNNVVLNFDIEVSMDQGLPDWRTAESSITSIACCNFTTKERFVYILDLENKLQDEFVKGNATIESFLDEESLLRRFLDKYEEIKPTILTGWHCDFFDIPYLYCRVARILGNYEANRLSPVGIVQYNERRAKFFIAGVSSLDYLLLYKKFSYSEEPNYTLDAIGKKEVNMGKIEYDGNLDDLFTEDIEGYVDYNLRDVDIVTKLDEKLQYIELVRGICHVGHIAYEDIYYSSRYLEGAILTFLKKRDIVSPDKPKDIEQQMYALKSGKVGFIGAYVKEPMKGRHEWVFDLDLTSLYPSIIMSLNISPETKVGKVTFGWSMSKYVSDKLQLIILKIGKDEYKFNGNELKKFVQDSDLAIASNGAIYRKDTKGVVPAILESWFNKRVEYKKLMEEYGNEHNDEKYEFYKKRQLVQKILLNSMYGALGLPAFRFYDKENAEAVTTTGRTIIKLSAKCANLFYNNELDTNEDYCIYSDTDSLYMASLPIIKHRNATIDISNESVMLPLVYDLASEIQDSINKFYDISSKKLFNVINHRFEIKRETVAKSGIWITKKRYAQWIVYDNGVHVSKLDVKGIDVVRSSFPLAFKKIMIQVLHGILNNEPKDKIDDNILTFKKQLKSLNISEIARSTSVKNIRKWDLQNTSIFKKKSLIYDRDLKIGIRKKNTPAHTKAAISYNELCHLFKVSTKYSLIRGGDKIKWVYLKNNPYGLESLAFKNEEMPNEILKIIELYIDYNKIFRRELENKLNDFYKALKWDRPTENKAIASKFFKF